MPDINIPDFDLNKELSKCKSMEDLVGKNGLMQRLFGNIIQQFLEAEMEERLWREKYERACEKKSVKTAFYGKNKNIIGGCFCYGKKRRSN